MEIDGEDGDMNIAVFFDDDENILVVKSPTQHLSV